MGTETQHEHRRMNEDRKLGSRDGGVDRPCDAWQLLRTLSAAGGELDPAEQSRLAAHLAECPACSADLAREQDALAVFAAPRSEPDAALLASCRAGLQDALDREEDRGWLGRSLGVMLPSSWLAPRPAWSAAILLLIGFAVGLFAPRLVLRAVPARAPQMHAKPLASKLTRPLLVQSSPAANNSAAQTTPAPATSTTQTLPPDSALTALDLHHATVAGINVLPSDIGIPPQLQLQLNAPQPFTLQGTVDDGDVRSVLLYVLRHGNLFDPEVRLGAVNALSPRSGDPDVRSALSHVLRQDASAAVRAKALRALNGSASPDLIGHMLLDALSGDQDPSVRVQAIDALRGLADSGQIVSDDHMLTVLRNRRRNDPDPYVRLQSAAVLRELASQDSGNP
jgi:HEAT repeats/Putative zinc-finger